MLLKHYLTEYDDSILGDTYIDPLGVLVVWSAFGQDIFQNTVNSISNDIRNYTLNLLNHAVIKSIIDDDDVVFPKSFAKAWTDKRSLGFKQACLIYLENLFTYTMTNPNGPVVNTSGVLGSSRAKKNWEDQGGDPTIYFTNKGKSDNGKVRYQLLIRQLGLGVSGRYKTPFSHIGFFSGPYDYHHPQGVKTWQAVNKLLASSPLLNAVYSQARQHLIDIIQTANGPFPPAVPFSRVPEALKRAYTQALPNAQVAGRETREFWLDITGLNQGAAGALLQSIERAFDGGNHKPSAAQAFAGAIAQADLAESELAKLTHVQTLEPLLGELALLFRIARQRKVHTIGDIEKNWLALGRQSTTLPDLAEQVKGIEDLKDVVTGSARTRLHSLLEAASNPTIEQQLEALLAYHKRIMRGRGQPPWVEMTEQCIVKVHGRTTQLPDADDRPLHTWSNSYYIPQFRNLIHGLRGEAQ